MGEGELVVDFHCRCRCRDDATPRSGFEHTMFFSAPFLVRVVVGVACRHANHFSNY